MATAQGKSTAAEINNRGMAIRDGWLACQGCNRPARVGWAWRFGEILLATCEVCVPKAPAWKRVCGFRGGRP